MSVTYESGQTNSADRRTLGSLDGLKAKYKAALARRYPREDIPVQESTITFTPQSSIFTRELRTEKEHRIRTSQERLGEGRASTQDIEDFFAITYAQDAAKALLYAEDAHHAFDETVRFESHFKEIVYAAAMAEWASRIKLNGYDITFPREAKAHGFLLNIVHPYLASSGAGSVGNDYSETTGTIKVISGENANTKSVYADSVALAHAMRQAGLFVVATEGELRSIDQILTHVVKAGDIAKGSSRAEMDAARTRVIYDRVTSNSLVYLDELNTGTRASEGGQATTDMLDLLKDLGATVLLTTHHDEPIDWAERTPGAQNLRTTVGDNGERLYGVVPGMCRHSDFAYILKKHGVDLSSAQELLRNRIDRGDLTPTTSLAARLGLQDA